MKKAYIYDTILGRIFIAEDGCGITDLQLLGSETDRREDSTAPSSGEFTLEETPLIKEAAEQLVQYLEGNRKDFTVRLHPEGTTFRKKVWEALRRIPYGETRTYQQIAGEIGNEKACRAVGMANHHNPILCIIPCHRVIGADGRLVGYAAGLQTKEQLLTLEKKGSVRK